MNAVIILMLTGIYYNSLQSPSFIPSDYCTEQGKLDSSSFAIAKSDEAQLFQLIKGRYEYI